MVQHHALDLRVVAQAQAATFVNIGQRPLVFLRFVLAETQQREAGTGLRVERHQLA